MGTFLTLPACSIDNPSFEYIKANGVYTATFIDSVTQYVMMKKGSSAGVFFGVENSSYGSYFIGYNNKDDIALVSGYYFLELSYGRAVPTTGGFYAVREITSSKIYSDVAVELYSTLLDACQSAHLTIIPYDTFPITYRLTNCTAPSAPTEAVVDDTVTVPLQFTTGYGIVNPSSDIYVTNNGVVVPSQYSNGVLTFTMPDPS